MAKKAKKMVKKVMKKVESKKKSKKMMGGQKECREYVDQLPTDVGGEEDMFEDVKLPGKKRVAKTENKALKVSYRAQSKAKKAAKKKK